MNQIFNIIQCEDKRCLLFGLHMRCLCSILCLMAVRVPFLLTWNWMYAVQHVSRLAWCIVYTFFHYSSSSLLLATKLLHVHLFTSFSITDFVIWNTKTHFVGIISVNLKCFIFRSWNHSDSINLIWFQLYDLLACGFNSWS